MGSKEPSGPPESFRRAEIVAGLARVRTRLVEAAEAADRDPRSITLIAVTKTFAAVDAATLVSLGVRELGENRDQEARPKAAEVARLRPDDEVRWHFVGQLQRNKARSVARYAHWVHTVDRPAVADALARSVENLDRDPLPVLIQLSLDGNPARGGVAAGGLAALADHVAGLPGVRLLGLMAVAPLGQDPDRAFAALAGRSAELRRSHPDAEVISAGMSADLEAAIRHGATHVRVGSALLGRRSPDLG
ncbi:MAG: YggS family pyridoxal phosphate-dependent enzyme [Actinobacteria bacterium]|nr:YggS family pyridoxal phosphate-dependent enzyme [Actinomycetota bacterium]